MKHLRVLKFENCTQKDKVRFKKTVGVLSSTLKQGKHETPRRHSSDTVPRYYSKTKT